MSTYFEPPKKRQRPMLKEGDETVINVEDTNMINVHREVLLCLQINPCSAERIDELYRSIEKLHTVTHDII